MACGLDQAHGGGRLHAHRVLRVAEREAQRRRERRAEVPGDQRHDRLLLGERAVLQDVHERRDGRPLIRLARADQRPERLVLVHVGLGEERAAPLVHGRGVAVVVEREHHAEHRAGGSQDPQPAEADGEQPEGAGAARVGLPARHCDGTSRRGQVRAYGEPRGGTRLAHASATMPAPEHRERQHHARHAQRRKGRAAPSTGARSSGGAGVASALIEHRSALYLNCTRLERGLARGSPPRSRLTAHGSSLDRSRLLNHPIAPPSRHLVDVGAWRIAGVAGRLRPSRGTACSAFGV